jgi:hypothetical protein
LISLEFHFVGRRPIARIHAAYTFNPEPFHRELEAKVVVGNHLRLEVLHDLAASIVATPSATTNEILELLRFDAGMLEPSTEQDANYRAEWYLMILADTMTPAPSLSHRCPVSFLALEYALPLTGWNRDEIKLLQSGQRLHTLVETSGNPIFVEEFWAVDQHGGWLSIEMVAKVLAHLLLVEGFFPSPLLEVRKEIIDLAGWWSRSPAELLGQAYADAREMLETALNRTQPLFLGIFD